MEKLKISELNLILGGNTGTATTPPPTNTLPTVLNTPPVQPEEENDNDDVGDTPIVFTNKTNSLPTPTKP